MTTHDHVNAVADALKAQVPGLTTRVDYGIIESRFILVGRYACPCGEISGLCQMFYEGDYLPPVELQVEHLKWALRDHVRKEGNEPNF